MLVELMRGGKDERVRGMAAQALLDRGWGKGKAEVPSLCFATFLLILDRCHCSLARPENCDSQFHQCSRY